MYEHALIIGGTGMLADTSRWVAARAKNTVVAARQPNALAAEISATPWEMDWTDQCIGLSTLVPMPTFDIVIAWLHRDGLWLAEHLQSKVALEGRFVHVHGSAAGNTAELEKRRVTPRTGIFTQNVILGRKKDGAGMRWLSKPEIAAGVIAALTAKSDPFIVGVL